jgi:hypothetical protein
VRARAGPGLRGLGLRARGLVGGLELRVRGLELRVRGLELRVRHRVRRGWRAGPDAPGRHTLWRACAGIGLDAPRC